jgi:hypothetical protein
VFTAAAAPSIALSTSSIQSDANTFITHTINGIAQGETVTVERFADLNNNGQIDFGEPPLRSFVVKDGVRPTVGGIVNGNVPGDDDGAANGSIRIDLPFPGVDEILNREPGKYIIRVTGTSGQATTPFEITAPNLPQKVTGVLKNSSNNANISFGIIVVLVGDGKPVGSVRTDSTGAFTFVAPAGDYALVPISDGFISAIQFVSIPANQSVTQNLMLTPATVRVSGKLSDASSGAAVPSVFVIAQAGNNQNQLISGALTDSNGNYSFSVNAGSWEISPLASFTSELGYMTVEKGGATIVGSTPITQDITIQKATALVYGKITNPSNAAVPNVSLRIQVPMGGGLESEGRSNANGDYFLGAIAGSWDAQTEGASALGFQDETKSFTVADGSATKWDFQLVNFTAHVLGKVVNSSGTGIANVSIHGRFENNEQSSSKAVTGADGSFDLPVWGGNWSIELSDDSGLISHQVNLTIVDGIDQTITYVVPNSTGQISGTVKNNSGQAVPGVFVSAQATVNGVQYQSSGQTDATGHYQLSVINGSWSVWLSCSDLQSQNYDCPNNGSATINNNNATMNFTLSPFITTASLNGRVVDQGGNGLPGMQVGAYDQTSGTSRSSDSGADGSFSIPVFAGNWNLQIFNTPQGYIGSSQQITVTDGVNVNNLQIKLLQINATIAGTLRSSGGAPIAGVRIYPQTTVDSVTYTLDFTTTDASGNFNFNVSRGSWSLTVDCNDLDVRSFNCVTTQAVDTTSGAATVNLVASPKVAMPIELQFPSLNQSGQIPIFQFNVHGSPGTYDVYGAPTLSSTWTVVTSATIGFGGDTAFVQFDPGANHFFRVQLR